MSEQKVMNRWRVVVGAMLMQISLGVVYIWSVFERPLENNFSTWSKMMVTLPSQIVLACFALAVIFGGRIQDKLGPRKVATAGGLILGLGLILAKMTGNFEGVTALAWLIGTFSVLGGIGMGIAYVCPITTCVKWFPDKRGLITGLAVAGFGAGAFFFAPLAKAMIDGGQYELLGAKFFAVPAMGVFNTFMALGIICLVAVVAGAQFLVNPPQGYVPDGWTPPQAAAGTAARNVDFTPSEMLSTPIFWILWLTYFAGCTAGLQVMMKASPIWQSMAVAGMKNVPAITLRNFDNMLKMATMAVGILAIFNSLGRIAWGKISDGIGRRASLVLMFGICGMTMILLNYMRSYKLYLLGVSLIGLCFGGFLALYPAITADFFGTKHMGVNYGWMFSAYGAGGLIGPHLAGSFMRVVDKMPYQVKVKAGGITEYIFDIGDYRMPFWVAGVACLVACVLIATAMKPPKAPEAKAQA